MDSKQIQEVTAQGIIYVDNDGDKRFIDFVDCLNTYLKWLLGNQTTTQRMIETESASKLIGEIDYLGMGDDPEPFTDGNINIGRPYVLFYDSQLTRFEFSSQNECAEFHQRLTDIGWHLFDLSD